jgi:hypothetical protein
VAHQSFSPSAHQPARSRPSLGMWRGAACLSLPALSIVSSCVTPTASSTRPLAQSRNPRGAGCWCAVRQHRRRQVTWQTNGGTEWRALAPTALAPCARQPLPPAVDSPAPSWRQVAAAVAVWLAGGPNPSSPSKAQLKQVSLNAQFLLSHMLYLKSFNIHKIIYASFCRL